MKVLILAGGLGSRLSEETDIRPKPMVEIGGRPILWHIMKIYSHWGFDDFVILTGYKSHAIKDFFINYYTRYSDITVDMADNAVEIRNHRSEPWKVTMLYTGKDTMTGGRLLAAKDFAGKERFMLAYGDGVGDVDIPELIKCHEKSGRHVTLTAVRPAGRFGALQIEDGGAVSSFVEKREGENTWINGGFFVMENSVFDYLDEGPATVLERQPLEQLASNRQLNAYKHNGFWKAMDTLKDKKELADMWNGGTPPWALWKKREE
jgi:glucose-1-phosphate cytidylyltransferase